MRVLKFGGSSLADAERFMRAANIIANNADQEELAVVLSAPGKTTNKLVAIIEAALEGQDTEHNVKELRVAFAELASEIQAALPNLQLEEFEAQVEESLGNLEDFIQGIQLLGTCPSHVNARIISKGEKVSIQLMKAVLEAKGQAAALIDLFIIFLLAAIT
ncbi:aspartokinase [Vibrio sp. JCM 19236]|nr:aspartokinase [Vibrio sp. JCM 19236]